MNGINMKKSGIMQYKDFMFGLDINQWFSNQTVQKELI